MQCDCAEHPERTFGLCQAQRRLFRHVCVLQKGILPTDRQRGLRMLMYFYERHLRSLLRCRNVFHRLRCFVLGPIVYNRRKVNPAPLRTTLARLTGTQRLGSCASLLQAMRACATPRHSFKRALEAHVCASGNAGRCAGMCAGAAAPLVENDGGCSACSRTGNAARVCGKGSLGSFVAYVRRSAQLQLNSASASACAHRRIDEDTTPSATDRDYPFSCCSMLCGRRCNPC